MKLLLDENLSRRLVPFLQHDFPPQVIRLRTPNQTRAAVLKLLLDNKEAICTALETQALASIELIA